MIQGIFLNRAILRSLGSFEDMSATDQREGRRLQNPQTPESPEPPKGFRV